MKKITAIMVTILMLLTGCSSTNSTKNEKNEQGNLIEGNNVIISQDHWDGDNFGLIRAAQNANDRGEINLLALDITGKDTGNYVSAIYSSLLQQNVRILINHAEIETRTTPTSQRYPRIDEFGTDSIHDTERDDSTWGLKDLLKRSEDGSVSYVVGGHLQNLESLLRDDEGMQLVSKKLKQVVISTGWGSRTDGKAEMNLSEGRYTKTGASSATQYVFLHLPKNIPIILASDPVRKKDEVPDDILRADDPLRYIVRHSPYYDKKNIKKGDFDALLWTFDQTWAVKVKTCFIVKDYGAVTIGEGKCNNYYLENTDNNYLLDRFRNLIIKES